MNQLLLQCKQCNRIFSSGIAMAPGASATFINNKSQCIYCGSMENIPDGTFRSTVEGFIKILEDSGSPLQNASELMEALQKIKTANDLLEIKKSSKFSKYEKWIPNSPEKIASYVAIIYTLVQLWTDQPGHIEYNTFINQYNQTIEVQVENKFTSTNNE